MSSSLQELVGVRSSGTPLNSLLSLPLLSLAIPQGHQKRSCLPVCSLVPTPLSSHGTAMSQEHVIGPPIALGGGWCALTVQMISG